MVGVGEHQRGAQVSYLRRGERLDRRLRANRRKDWRLERAMRRGEGSSAGAVVLDCYIELKH